ncbi:MAG: MFS transporter [Spirochaetia bacterium]|jgi:predicted MFS family arabinose efflux permease
MNRKRIAALFGAAVLYFVALYAYVPSLPAYVAERTSRLAAVGVVLSMYGLWMAVLRMPLGVVADATGRNKPYLVIGVLLAGIGAVVMAFGKSLGMLAFGRALTGAAAAAWVPMMVVFAGFFPPDRTIFATSLMAFASSVGQIIGTSLTGFLESLGGYALAFFAAAGFSVAAAIILACVRIPRADADHRGQVSARSVISIFRRRDVLVPSFTNALCQFGVWALTFGFMPLLAQRMGASAVSIGLIMTLNIAANVAANLFATLAANRGGRVLLYGSFVLFSLGAVLAAFGQSIFLLFVSTVVMGLANGLFFPILLGLSIQGVDAAHRSTAMGIHQSVYAIGMFTGPWIGGIIADAVGIRTMFAIIAAFCLAAPSVLMVFNRAPSPGPRLPQKRARPQGS